MSNEIKPTEIKPTDVEPTKIEPTDVEPTDVEPTDIKPTNIEPTKIEPTEIKPTEIKPTEIKPTNIKPTDVQSSHIEQTNIQPTNVNKPIAKFSNKTASTYFISAIIGSFITLFVGLNLGWGLYMIPIFLGTLSLFLGFFRELKKMNVTQKDLDDWKNEILKKHPNFNTNNLMTLEDLNKSVLQRFSYWTHTLKISFLKVIACVMLPVAVLSAGAGLVVPLVSGGSIGGGDVAGYTYISDAQGTSYYSVTVVTAYKFNKNNTYQMGYYDKETKKYTWTDSGKYSKSGSKVTVKNGYFTIKNNGKKLMGSDGSYFVRV